MTQENPKKPQGLASKMQAWSLAFELGYTIAIPIVLLALAGRYLDKTFNTAPFLLLAGILLSIFISTAIIYKKVKTIL